MPVAVLLYLASYIDRFVLFLFLGYLCAYAPCLRANIGNARVLGLAKDLKLTSGQYNWALSIFFIGYVVFETPSNIILKKLQPRLYIPTLTV
jgi:hypothetical protein